jgi:hypothetical protein
LLNFFNVYFQPPGGKVRRPIRTSVPSNGDGSTSQPLTGQVPTIASGTPSGSARTNAKIKSAVAGSDGPIVFCPSPPKKLSSSSAPPSSASIIRRNSAGPTPTLTPPSAIKGEILVTRRVRSGPKERSSPLSPDCANDNEETNGKISYSANGTSSEESSPRKDVKQTDGSSSGDKRKRRPASEPDKTKDELAVYYEEQIKPLLFQMEEKFSADNTSELCRDCLKLWNLLERRGMMGKASGTSSARRRGEILKTLFKFLDVTDPRLMLRLGKLILSVSI